MTTNAKLYDDVFLACRDLRHPWELVGYYRQDGVVRRILECARCGTQRHDKWHNDGEREPSHYNYVEDYQVEGGFDTWAVRREVIRRAKVHSSLEAMLAASGKVRSAR